MRRLKALSIFTVLMLFIASGSVSCAGAKVRQYKAVVVREHPHDELSYTQGLFFHNGQMYETTGQYGESTLRKVDIANGKAVKKFDFNKKYFVEGSVVLGDTIYILTWTNKVVFLYDAETMEYKSTWSYPREGWGLTTDGESLIASDGTSRLFFLDRELRQQRTLNVKMNGRPVNNLNELEWIDGKIWANVYLTDMILIINPKDGTVEATVDCQGLLPKSLKDEYTDVLNGIAYNPSEKKIYLTGKYWKRLYEVRLEEKK